jgi:hypothetical protein
MDLIEGSETSANINQTLGIHPKIETVNTEHSESLKSRISAANYSIYYFLNVRLANHSTALARPFAVRKLHSHDL